MSQTISRQHPEVVLRSHYVHLRTLLAIAMIALVGLAAAVVALATSRDHPAPAPSSVSAPVSTGTSRYDWRPEEGTRGPATTRSTETRYDGGPEEGTRGPGH